MPKKKTGAKFDFASVIRRIRQAEPGRERNMYPAVRDLLVHSLGHSPERVMVDTNQPGTRDAPDLVLRSESEILDPRIKPIMLDWAVFEVKGESGVFGGLRSREAVFDEKLKYAKIGTEWFVMVDPGVLVARPMATASRLDFDPRRDVVVEWNGLTEAKFKEALWFLRATGPGLRNRCAFFGRVTNPESPRLNFGGTGIPQN